MSQQYHRRESPKPILDNLRNYNLDEDEFNNDDADYQEEAEINKKVREENAKKDNEDVGEEEPITPEQQEDYIERIIVALKNTDDVDELPKAQAVEKIRGGQYYPEEAFRQLAVDALARCTKAQAAPLVASFHKQPYETFGTLAERLETLIESFQRSKNNTKMALDAPYLDRLCDAPRRVLKSKKNNQAINDRRNIEVSEGKKVLQQRSGNNVEGNSVVTPQKHATPRNSTPKTPKAVRERYIGSTTRNSNSLSKRKLEDSPQSSCKRSRKTIKKEADRPPQTPAARPMLESFPSPRDVRDSTLHHHYQAFTLLEIEAYVVNRSSSGSGSGSVHWELLRRYREIICRLLGVGPQEAEHLPFGQLRTYARAHYSPMQNHYWYHPLLPRRYVAGNRALVWLQGASDGNYVHMTEAFPLLLPIAILRGDVNPDGSFNPEHENYIPQPLSREEERAMGLVENPLSEGVDYLGREGIAARDPR